MAVNLTGKIWTFDAVGQTYTRGAAATVGLANTLSTRQLIYVRYIDLISGATGGAAEVLDAAGGRSITGSIVLSTNDKVRIDVEDYVEGIYIGTLPATCSVVIGHGNPR